ncbi:MAG: hypothetical protein ACLTKG_02180 [Collinsella intestinalis]
MNRLEYFDQWVRAGYDEHSTLVVFKRDVGDRLEKVVRREEATNVDRRCGSAG